MRQLAFALILLISASTHSQMCIDLFTIGRHIKDLEEYSLRRFEPALDKIPAATPAQSYWSQRTGKPIFVFQNWIRWNKTTHVSLHMSPKQEYVVSMGSDQVVRIIHVESGKIIQSIKIGENHEFMKSDDFRIVAVTDSHFVIASEHSWHHNKYEEMGLRMFRPEKLSAIDFKGNILANYYSELVIKGSVYLERAKTWIVADQSSIETIKLPQGQQHGTTFALTSILHDSLVTHHYVSALGLSRDGSILYVGMSKSKHKDPTSEILSIDISNLDKPQLITTKIVELSQVYSIRQRADGSLAVKGSHVIDHSSDPIVEITAQ